MLQSVLLDREVAARRCGFVIFTFCASLEDIHHQSNYRNLAGYGFHTNPSASTTLNAPFEQWLLEKVPPHIMETPFPVSVLQSFDKIFASQWLDSKTIVTGSKDNKVRLESRTGRLRKSFSVLFCNAAAFSLGPFWTKTNISINSHTTIK